MAILKIKALIRDLQGNGRELMTDEVSKASTAGQSGTAFTFTAPQLRGLFNRIVGTSMDIRWLGTGGTTGQANGQGVKIVNELSLVINGVFGTSATCIDLHPPVGTQGAATYCKYLVSTGFGSSGTITAGVEAAASTSAKLPTVPSNHVALGYFEFKAPAAAPWIRGADAVATGKIGAAITGGATATAGTTIVNGAVCGVGQDPFTLLNGIPFLE